MAGDLCFRECGKDHVRCLCGEARWHLDEGRSRSDDGLIHYAGSPCVRVAPKLSSVVSPLTDDTAAERSGKRCPECKRRSGTGWKHHPTCSQYVQGQNAVNVDPRLALRPAPGADDIKATIRNEIARALWLGTARGIRKALEFAEAGDLEAARKLLAHAEQTLLGIPT